MESGDGYEVDKGHDKSDVGERSVLAFVVSAGLAMEFLKSGSLSR